MPLQPNFIERFLISRGHIPNLLLDVGMSVFQYWSLVAAMDIGLFEVLRDGECTLEELARRTECSERGIKILANALEPLGYVESTGGSYKLSKAAERSLPIGQLRDMVPFIKAQMLEYTDVTRAIREAPEDGIFGWDKVKSGEVGQSYQATMRWLASNSVDEVVKKIDPPREDAKMLDLGGSHGLYTVKFCRKYPGMSGSILDWPIGLEAARQTLDDNPGIADRIDLVERDFEKEALPEGYDFVFLGNIIHGIDADGNRELFDKISRATTDEGKIVILDQLGGISGSKFARGIAALLGFNLFLFSGGRSYPFETVKEWLQKAGFSDVSHKKTQQPGFSLVIGQKT